MAIRVPNLGLGDGKTGDTELKIRQDYNHNFNDQTNAASRIVGEATGNVMQVGAFGWGSDQKKSSYLSFAIEAPTAELKKTQMVFNLNDGNLGYGQGLAWSVNERHYSIVGSLISNQLFVTMLDNNAAAPNSPERGYKKGSIVIEGINATRDSNGFLKGASPIAEIYSDKMDLNQDATQQGGITFEKLGVGDYLVKGSLGFAQDGWYIETPKDANGNVLVAVVYKQLENNDLSIKTYAKKFDDETGDIVANLLKPRDIPVGRFISLRLHELPKEPPVMPVDTQPEI